jgi:DNA-binding NarL/FixJ family response regulator
MDDAAINVLLADDDEGFLASLRELVDRQPELAVVATATDGRDAIELAARFQPEAAVIDLRMPRLDGVATIARLRKDHPTMCLIALTGDGDRDLHEGASRAGADAVLEKGQLLGALIDRLTSVRAA